MSERILVWNEYQGIVPSLISPLSLSYLYIEGLVCPLAIRFLNSSLIFGKAALHKESNLQSLNSLFKVVSAYGHEIASFLNMLYWETREHNSLPMPETFSYIPELTFHQKRARTE